MPPKPKNNPQTGVDRVKLLKKIPASAYGVQVRDVDGNLTYRSPTDVEIDDEIMCKENGDPIVTMKKPGRPTKVQLEPINEGVAEIMAARDGHNSVSDLIKHSRQDPEGDAVFNAIMMALADEASVMEFERKEAERLGKPTEDISSKRSRVLKAMSDAWLKRRNMTSEGSIDFESKAWETILLFIMETIRESLLECNIRHEQVETIFTHVGKTMNNDWYDVARSKMKGK